MEYSIMDITTSEMIRGYTILNKLYYISRGGRWRYINHSHSIFFSPCEEWKERWMLGWIDGWMDRWMDG